MTTLQLVFDFQTIPGSPPITSSTPVESVLNKEGFNGSLVCQRTVFDLYHRREKDCYKLWITTHSLPTSLSLLPPGYHTTAHMLNSGLTNFSTPLSSQTNHISSYSSFLICILDTSLPSYIYCEPLPPS